jgi:hypothetical protein
MKIKIVKQGDSNTKGGGPIYCPWLVDGPIDAAPKK